MTAECTVKDFDNQITKHFNRDKAQETQFVSTHNSKASASFDFESNIFPRNRYYVCNSVLRFVVFRHNLAFCG